MNERKFIVSAAQLAPVLMDVEATLEKAIAAIAEAGRLGSRLLVFPEVFLAGYPFWTLHLDPTSAKHFRKPFIQSAVEFRGAAMEKLAAAAQAAGVFVVMGFNEREGGTVYNSQAFISPVKGIQGRRRKLMPTFHERMIWGKGDGRDIDVFPTEIGIIGGLICFEHSNALYRYAMQSQGEQIHVAMWPGGISNIPGIIDAAMRHYAFEGQCFVVNATAINTLENIAALGVGGSLETLRSGGGVSGIIDPRGTWLVRADPDKEEIVSAEIDYDLIDEQKVFVDSAGHYARPDIMRLVMNRRAHSPVVSEHHPSDDSAPHHKGPPHLGELP